MSAEPRIPLEERVALLIAGWRRGAATEATVDAIRVELRVERAYEAAEALR